MPNPPRGYFDEEFPLPHNFEYNMRFNAESATKAATIMPIIRATEAFATPETIEVNPSNATFAEETGASVHMGSIVPKVNLVFQFHLTQAAIETDKIRAIRINYMPIYSSFLSTLEAEDARTAIQVEDILELEHQTDNKDTEPIYNGVDMAAGLHPMNTVAATEVFGDWGLTVDTKMEYITWDKGQMFNAFQYFDNASMLNKATGQYRSITLTRDRPYLYYSDNFTQPSVKRGNPYTFCGLLIYLPQAGARDQFFEAGEVTDIAHVYCKAGVRYGEWNPNFDQSAY